MRFAIATLFSTLVVAEADSYEGFATPIMYPSNFTYAGIGSMYYSFESGEKWVSTTNQVSFNRPVSIGIDDITNVFSCMAYNLDDSLETGAPEYICMFFRSRQQSSSGNGAMAVSIRPATPNDLSTIINQSVMKDDPSSSTAWSLARTCEYQVSVSEGKAVTTKGEEDGCDEYDVPESFVTMTATGWTARLTHNTTYGQAQTATQVMTNQKTAMYTLATGTWLSVGADTFYNTNLVGLIDTAELPEAEESSGALALGSAAIAATLALLAF